MKTKKKLGDAYSMSKAISEKLLLEACADDSNDLKVSIVRPNHITGVSDPLIDCCTEVPFPFLVRFGDAKKPPMYSFIYIENCAHAHILVAKALADPCKVYQLFMYIYVHNTYVIVMFEMCIYCIYACACACFVCVCVCV